MNFNHKKNLKSLFTSILIGFAVFMHGIGLLAPLTPSDGNPHWIAVLVFWILPLATTTWASRRTQSTTGKLAKSSIEYR